MENKSLVSAPSRLNQLAQVIIDQALAVQKGDRVSVYTSTHLGLPLARAVYRRLLTKGALPVLEIDDEASQAAFLQLSNEQQLTTLPNYLLPKTSYFDKFVQIIAPENNAYLAGIAAEKMMQRAVVMQPLKEIKLHKPWNLTYYPTPAVAQAANLSLEQLEDFYFAATLQDWPQLSQRMTQLATYLNQVKTLQIIGEQTDLTLSVAGHRWDDQDWRCNLPGGEVFTTPVKVSAQGQIYFNFPLTYQGTMMTDIKLVFDQGRVVKSTASQNQDFLQALLQTDPGASYLGEVAFGLNPGCTHFMNNVLFDEKMAGTIHLALGESFPECGLDNRSALHLDIIKDMSTTGSRILADQKEIFSAGQLLI